VWSVRAVRPAPDLAPPARVSWEPNCIGVGKLYHGTTLANARRILATGLEPRRVPHDRDDLEPLTAVFLTPALALVRFHEVVLTVKVKNLPLVRVNALSIASLEPIKAKRVVKITDPWHDRVVWRRK
jgi:hypothetical protein